MDVRIMMFEGHQPYVVNGFIPQNIVCRYRVSLLTCGGKTRHRTCLGVSRESLRLKNSRLLFTMSAFFLYLVQFISCIKYIHQVPLVLHYTFCLCGKDVVSFLTIRNRAKSGTDVKEKLL